MPDPGERESPRFLFWRVSCDALPVVAGIAGFSAGIAGFFAGGGAPVRKRIINLIYIYNKIFLKYII